MTLLFRHTSFLLFIILSSLLCCTLEEDPDIPANISNKKDPVFLSTDIAALTHDSIRAKVRLSFRGNLNILHHGWVWSESPGPTLQDASITLETLDVDSFETYIPGLTLGKTYYMRPYVATGSGETFGPEQTIFMGIPKVDDITLIADSACFLRIENKLQNPLPLLDYGVVYLVGAGTPTLQKKDGQVTGSGFGNGTFQVDLTMLSPHTNYTIRTYAVTSAGTGYSKVTPVTTPASTLLAGFSFNTDAEIFQGADVLFVNTSIGGTVYSWDFGDGTISAQPSPIHIFAQIGDRRVRLTAENGGCTATKDTLFKVVADPFQDYWVAIPGGTFMMGCTVGQGPDCSADAQPMHQVTVDSFFIGKTEITQGQYQAVTGNNPGNFYLCGLDCPVESVSWDRIKNEFIPALQRKTGRIHRLPTEAEWEYAARAGMDTKFAGSDDINLVGWYNDSTTQIYSTHLVAQKLPNGFGLFDMTGNVLEWCQDYYLANYYAVSSAVNPTGPESGTTHIIRGGFYYSPAQNSALSVRSDVLPHLAPSTIGFRLVR